MQKLKQSINDAIDEINQVLPVIANDASKFSVLSQQRAILNRQLLFGLSETLTANHTELSEACAALQEVSQIAKQTQRDVSQINRLLEKVTDTVTLLEKLAKSIGKVI